MGEASAPVVTRLSAHTTLRLGGPATSFVTATTEGELVAAVAEADAAGTALLVLGGGSNLVVADAGFEGVVVKVATTGITADAEAGDDPACGGVLVTVAAGEPWDDVVATAVDRGWTGLEALSGIPGSTGATPIQNVGAYGQEVSQTIARVRVWDRRDRTVRTIAAGDCGFGYRHSRFKAHPGRHVVLDVTFQLRQGTLSAPVGYAELARTLGIAAGERAPLLEVRDAVLGLRAGKGMVLDTDDHDTWSAGSFFTNPIVPADQVPEGAPSWPAGDLVKTSAAWLIEHAGFAKGYVATAAGPGVGPGVGPGSGDGTGAGTAPAGVSLSTKHTLAVTNRGSATTDELLRLVRQVRDGVEAAYGIRLVNEPVLVGCEL